MHRGGRSGGSTDTLGVVLLWLLILYRVSIHLKRSAVRSQEYWKGTDSLERLATMPQVTVVHGVDATALDKVRVARWVPLRARWVPLRARWVPLRARWVTLRAPSFPTFASRV